MKNNRYLRENCIVLKHSVLNDNDAILSFYGEHLGKFTALVKGLRKKNSKLAPQLQIAHQVEVELLHSQSGYLLTSSLEMDLESTLFHHYETTITAIYLCELVSTYSIEEIEITNFYFFFVAYLKSLNHYNYVEHRLFFEWYFLSLLGYGSTDTENFLHSFYEYWKSKNLNVYQRSIVDEIMVFLKTVPTNNKQHIPVLTLSHSARTIFRDILSQEYRKHLPGMIQSQRVLDEATISDYS